MAKTPLPGETRTWSRRGPVPSESPESARRYLEAALGSHVADSLLELAADLAVHPGRWSISAEKARRAVKLAQELLPLLRELNATELGQTSTAVRMAVPMLEALPGVLREPDTTTARGKALELLHDSGRQTRFAYHVLAFVRYVNWHGSAADLGMPKYDAVGPTIVMALAVALGVERGTARTNRDAAKVEADKCFDRWRKCYKPAKYLADTLIDTSGKPPPRKPLREPPRREPGQAEGMANALRRDPVVAAWLERKRRRDAGEPEPD